MQGANSEQAQQIAPLFKGYKYVKLSLNGCYFFVWLYLQEVSVAGMAVGIPSAVHFADLEACQSSSVSQHTSPAESS